MRVPARIERGRLGRHAHVIDKLRDQIFIPLGGDKFVQIGEVHGNSALGVKPKVYGC